MTPPLRHDPTQGDAVCAVALDLHRFVSHVQRPRAGNRAWNATAQARCAELGEKVASVRDAAALRRKAAGDSLDRIGVGLRAFAAELGESQRVVRLKQVGRRLAVDYEELRAELRDFQRQAGTRGVRLPAVKPVTWSRSVFHGCMGVGAVLLYHFVLTYWQSVAIMGLVAFAAATLEITRRFSRRWNAFLVDRVFGPVARPWERHRTNSATWYTFGMLVLAVVMPKPATEVGLLALAFGDPAASLVGRQWGTRKLWRDKSYAGTGAFLVAVLVVTGTFLALTAPELSIPTRIFLPFLVAGVGAFAELFSDRVDDNFSIPVLCAGVVALWYL